MQSSVTIIILLVILVCSVLLNYLHFYWWPSLSCFVQWYATECPINQATKPCYLLSIPSTPFSLHLVCSSDTLSLNFITRLPSNHGFDIILVIINYDLTEGGVFIPCHSIYTANQYTQLLYKNIYKYFGWL